jgi:hypothetical protein
MKNDVAIIRFKKVDWVLLLTAMVMIFWVKAINAQSIVFHAPKCPVYEDKNWTNYYVYDASLEGKQIELLNIKNINCTFIDAVVSLNKQSKFQMTITVLYLKLKTWGHCGRP